LIKTALTNLIENAIKFSQGKVVAVTLASDNEMVQVMVKDEGIGIDEEELDKIFEPFHRGQNALGIAGHGLGLSLAKIIIEQHKGRISINTKKGKGTSISVFLPHL
jgi:signal transduction histidine kinase